MSIESKKHQRRSRLVKATAFVLVFGFVAAQLPVAPASAAGNNTPASSDLNSPAQSAPASVISAMVPYLPMEPGGVAFARIFTLNLGSSPTTTSSTTSIDIAGLPAGVTIVGATPEPSASAPGWKCEQARCSWVAADGSGVQIPMGQTVEGMLKLKIDATAQLPTLTDAEVAQMADISTKKTADSESAMNAIAAKLARVNISTMVDGDTGATSQQTQSYLAVTDQPGRARVVPVLSVPTGLEPGDAAVFSLSLVNIGGAASADSLTIAKPIDSEAGLGDFAVKGEGWSCDAKSDSVDSCTYGASVAPGVQTASATLNAIVRNDAATGDTKKWVVKVDGAPEAVPTDVSFTVSKPQAPDLGVDLSSSTPVVVAGGTVSLSAQIATYAGKTRSPVTLTISGLPGATIDKVENSGYGKNKPELTPGIERPVPPELADSVTVEQNATSTVDGKAEASSADTKPVDDLSNCVAIKDGVRCDVRPIAKAEVLVAGLTLRLPKDFVLDKKVKSSVSVSAEIEVAEEDSSTQANNTDSTPIIVQPSNIPYPAIFPVRKNAVGEFEKFSGDSMLVVAGKSDVRTFAVSNAGAVEFPAGTTFRVSVAAGEGFAVKPSGWDCAATKVDAPQFSEERRTQATITASSESLFFDVNQSASPIEKQLLEQVKEQTSKTPIAQGTGTVPGFDCSLTLTSPLAVSALSTPLSLTTTASVDADTTVQIWQVSLVEPKVDETLSTDFTVMTKARRHVVRPAIMTSSVRSGAASTVSIGLSNKGEDAAEHPAVLVSMPSRTMITTAQSMPKGWRCVQIAPGLSSGLVVCTGAKLAPGQSSDPAVFDFKAFADRAKASNISAVALTNGRKVGLTSATTAEIGVKPPIKIQVTGPDSVNDVSIPLSGGEPTNTTVFVSAQSSTEGLRYEWKQLCTTSGEENCISVAPAVKFTKAYGPNAEVTMPRVKVATNIVLQVTGYDGDAKASTTHTIRLEPRPALNAPPKADPNDPVGYEAPGQSLRPRAAISSAPDPGANDCESRVAASIFRLATTGCRVFAVAGDVVTLTVDGSPAALSQLSGGASWIVSDDAAWLSSSVTGSAATSRIRLTFSQNTSTQVRSSVVSLSLRPVTGSAQALGTFVLKQYPKATETPVATDAPAATDVPPAKATPAATEPPVVTEAPAATDAPAAKATPAATEPPVVTEAPTAEKTATDDTATVAKADKAVGDEATTTSAAANDDATKAEDAKDKTENGLLAAPPVVEMPKLDVKKSNGGGSPAGLTSRTRGLGAVAVRANVLGGNVIAAEAGGVARALASASIGSTVTWAWRVIGGTSPIAKNQSFIDAVEALKSASFRVTLPQNADDVVEPTTTTTTTIAAAGEKLRNSSTPDTAVSAADEAPAGTDNGAKSGDETKAIESATKDDAQVIVVAVTATNSAGVGFQDILVIRIGKEVPEKITKAIALEGVNSNNQLILGISGSATLGAAVAEGHSIEWTASSDSITLSDKSNEAVKVTASSSPSGASIIAIVKSVEGEVVDAIVIPVVTNLIPALDDFCSQISTELKSLIDRLPSSNLADELTKNVPDCKNYPVISFKDKSISLPVLNFSNVNGRISRSGIWLKSGTVESTIALPVKNVSVKNVLIPFRRTESGSELGPVSGALSAAISDTILTALHLEGWNVDGTIKLANGEPKAVIISAKKTICPETTDAKADSPQADGETPTTLEETTVPAAGSKLRSADTVPAADAEATTDTAISATADSVASADKAADEAKPCDTAEKSASESVATDGADKSATADTGVEGAETTVAAQGSKLRSADEEPTTTIDAADAEEPTTTSTTEPSADATKDDAKTDDAKKDDAKKDDSKEEVKVGPDADSSVTITGVYGDDNSLLLAVEAVNLGLFSTVWVSGNGTIEMTENGSLTVDVSASLVQPLSFTDGVTLAEGAFHITNNSLEASGKVEVDRDGIKFDADAAIKLTDEEQSIELNGNIASLTPVSGFTLNNVAVGGKFNHNKDGFSGRVDLKADDISFGGDVLILKSPTLKVAFDCTGNPVTLDDPETKADAEAEPTTTTTAVDAAEEPTTTTTMVADGEEPTTTIAAPGSALRSAPTPTSTTTTTTTTVAPEEPTTTVASDKADEKADDKAASDEPKVEATSDKSGCQVAVAVGSDLEINAVGKKITGSLAGSVNTSEETAQFVGHVDTVDFGSGIVLNSVDIDVAYNKGDVSANIAGSLSIFDTTITASASLSKDRVILEAGLGKFAPFGVDGPGVSAGALVAVVKLPAGESFAWEPAGEGLSEFVPEGGLVEGDVRLVALVDMPAAFANVKALTGDRFALPSQAFVYGAYSFGSGAASLSVGTIDGSVSVSGAFTRAESGAKWGYDITVSVPEPIQIVSGLSLESFSLRLTNLDKDGNPVAFSLKGDGKLKIDLPSASVTVSAAVEFVSAQEWSMEVSGDVPTFTAIPGLVFTGLTFSGSITRSAAGYAGALKIGAEDISFGGGAVVLTSPQLDLGVQCRASSQAAGSSLRAAPTTTSTVVPSTTVPRATTTTDAVAPTTTVVEGDGAKDAGDAPEVESADAARCSLKLDASTGVRIDFGPKTVTGTLSGSVDTAAGTAELKAQIDEIEIVDGLKITETEIDLSVKSGEISFVATGGVSIFDTELTAKITITKDRVILEAGLGKFAPFGVDGPGVSAGALVAVVKLPAGESFAWEPAGEGLSEFVPEGGLVEGDVRLVALVDMPAAFANVKALTGDRFALPSQAFVYGAYSFGSGAASLSVGTIDGSVSVSGAFTRAESGAKWGYDITVSVPEPIQIVSGLSLESFSLRLTNLDKDGNPVAFSLKGDGKLKIDLPSASVTVSAAVEFVSAQEWSMEVSGDVPTFTAIPGLVFTGLTFSGSITRSAAGYAGALKIGAEDISFGGGAVVLTSPQLDLGVQCRASSQAAGSSLRAAPTTTSTVVPSTTVPRATTTTDAVAPTTTVVEGDGAKDAGDAPEVESADAARCSLKLDASTGVRIDFGPKTVTGTLSGSVDTAAGTAELKAQIDEIEIVDGLKITETEIDLSVKSGEISFVATGGVSIFDTELTAKITISKDDAVFQASVANLAPFGPNGPSITVGEVVVALGGPEEGVQWTPLDERLNDVVGETMLEDKQVRLAVIVGMPSAFSQVETLTKGVVALPSSMVITGSYNFSTGAATLTAAATSNTFDISGSLSREAESEPWAWDVDFRTNREIAIIPSFDRLKLTNFGVHIGNVGEDGQVGSLSVQVTGAVKIQVNASTTLSLGAEVSFQSASQWRLTITGAIAGQNGGNWQLFPGVSLPAAQATGTIEKNGDNFSASIRLEQTSDWQPVTQVVIKDLYVEVGITKADGSWDFEFGIGGKLKLTFGSVSIPELAISGGYQRGVWFLQVEVGDEVCRNVPVANSNVGDDSESAAPTTTVFDATTTTESVTTTSTPATTTSAAPGQSLRNAPPTTSGATTTTASATTTSVGGTTTTAAGATTTTADVAETTTTPTEQVCERVIEITDGLEILNATFRLEYDTNTGTLAAKVSGGLRILGFVIEAEVRLSNRGLFMSAGVRNWEIFDGGPVFSDLAVVFSTYQTTYTLTSGYEATVPGMDVTLIAQMGTPEGIQKTIGDIQLEPLVISLVGLLTGNIDINIGIVLPDDAWIFDTGSYGLRLASAGLMLKIRNFADITIGIYGEARLKVPGPPRLVSADGEEQAAAAESDSITDKCKADIANVDTNADVAQSTMEVPFRIAIGISVNGSINISASLGLDSKGNVHPWCNVFGIDGMNIYFAAFSFGINFTTTPIPTPEIGIALAFEFPTVIKDLIGMDEGIKIEGFFFFSTTKGICFGVEVGDPPKVGQTSRDMKKALDLFDHNVIGNYIGFKFAPIGCTIAEKTYDPGISLGFAAQLFGISVVVYAKLDIKKLEITAYVNIDPINVGPVHVDQTYLDLKISGTDPLDSHIIFAGGVTLDMPSGPTRISMKLAAIIGSSPSFAIDARIDNLVIVSGILEVRKARIQGLVTISPLALFINLEGDVSLLGQKVTGSFRLDVDSSGLREISATLKADINLAGVVKFNGDFAFSYLKGGFPSMDFNGKLIIAGKELASASGHLDQYYFSISAALDLGIFKGQIAGKVVFCNKDGSIKITNRNDQEVTAASGDFYFAASAGIDLGIVNANGAIKFGRAPDTDVVQSQECPVLTPSVTSQDADAVMDKYFQQTMSTAPGYGCPTTTTSVAPTSTAVAQTTTSVACVAAPTTTTTVAAAPTTTVRPGVSVNVAPTTTTTIATATATTVPTSTSTAPLSTAPIATSTTVRATTTTRAPGQSLRPRAASAASATCVDQSAISGLTGFQFSNLACSAIEAPAGGGTVSLSLPSATVTAGRQDSADKQYSSAITGFTGLSSYFRLDDASSTPTGQTATFGSGMSALTQGRLGGGRSFTATGDNRFTFNGIKLNDQTNWTIQAWIKPAEVNVNRWQAIISGETNSIGLHIKYGTDKLAITRIGVSDGTASTVAVKAGVWQHVALVKNGTTVTYYIDGKAAGTTSIPTSNGTNALTKSVGNGTSINDPFKGDIDEVAIHTSALSAADLASLVTKANVIPPKYSATVLGDNGQALAGASAQIATVLSNGTYEPGAVTVTMPAASAFRRSVVSTNINGTKAAIALSQAPSTTDAPAGPTCLRIGGTTQFGPSGGLCDVVEAATGAANDVDLAFSATVLGTASAGGGNGTISITGVPTWLTAKLQNVGLGGMPKSIKLSATASIVDARSAKVTVNYTVGSTVTKLGEFVYVQRKASTATPVDSSQVTAPACASGSPNLDTTLGCVVIVPNDSTTRAFRLSDSANSRVRDKLLAGVDGLEWWSDAATMSVESLDGLFNGQGLEIRFTANEAALANLRLGSFAVRRRPPGSAQFETLASVGSIQPPAFTRSGDAACSAFGSQSEFSLMDLSGEKPCGRIVAGTAGATFVAKTNSAVRDQIAAGIASGKTVRAVADQSWVTLGVSPPGVGAQASTPSVVVVTASALPENTNTRRATVKMQLVATDGTSTDVGSFDVVQIAALPTGTKSVMTCRKSPAGSNGSCASVALDETAGIVRIMLGADDKAKMAALIGPVGQPQSGSIEVASSGQWIQPTLAAYANGIPGEIWFDAAQFVSDDSLARSATITVSYVSPTGTVLAVALPSISVTQNVGLTTAGSGLCLNNAPSGAASMLVLRCGELLIDKAGTRERYDVAASGVTNAITNGLKPLYTSATGGEYRVASDAEWMRVSLANGSDALGSGGLLVSADALSSGVAQRSANVSLIYATPAGVQTVVATTVFSQSTSAPANNATLGCLRPTDAATTNVYPNCDSVVAVKSAAAGVAVFDLDVELLTSLRTQRAAGGATVATSDAAWATVELYDWQVKGSGSAVPTKAAVRFTALAESADAYREANINIGGTSMVFAQENLPRTTAGKGYAPIACNDGVSNAPSVGNFGLLTAGDDGKEAACNTLQIAQQGGSALLSLKSINFDYPTLVNGLGSLDRYYRLNETAGSAVVGTQGSNGTRGATGVNAGVAGKDGNAYEFTGSGDNRASFQGINLDTTANWTIEAWIKPAEVNVNRWQAIISGERNALGFHIKYGTDKLAVTRIGISDGTPSTIALKANEWQHVALVKSGSQVTYYVNGVNAGTSAIPTGNGTTALTSTIGNGSNVDDRYKGSIDEVAIHSAALSATQLATVVSPRTIDQASAAAFTNKVGVDASAVYVGVSASSEAMTTRPVFDATSGKIAYAYVKVGRVSSAARDRCTTVSLWDETVSGGTRTTKFASSFCQSKIGTIATRADRPQAFADAGQAAGTFNTFPNTWSTDGDTFKFTSQPTAQIIELKTQGVTPASTPTEWRAIPADLGVDWARAMVWNGVLANNLPNKFFVQIAQLPFEATSRSAKFNFEGKVDGTWTRLASFYVTQVREAGTERYTQPDRLSKKITCLTGWNGGSANYFNVTDGDWQNGVNACKEVQVGYRVKRLRVYNGSWGTSPVYNLGANDSTVSFTMFRANPAPQYAYTEWSNESTDPKVRDKNNIATVKSVDDVWTREGYPSRWVHKMYTINYDGWDGATRYAYVTGYTANSLGTNLKWRDYGDTNMLLNIKFMGIDDMPEYPITPPPPVDGDPGPNGVTCVTGNSPIWYNDGSGNQDKRCKVIEVGSNVTTIGLDVANEVRTNVYNDVAGTDDCIGPTKVSAESDSTSVELTSTVDYRSGGFFSNVINNGTNCSITPAEGGRTVWNLKPVRAEEISVTRVVLKHSVALGYDRAKWFEGKTSPLSAAETRGVFSLNSSVDEVDGEFYIVKYGSKAVEAESKAWDEAVAASEGASPYAVTTPGIGAAYVEAAQAAAQSANNGLPTRVAWGHITLSAGINIGPLQGSFSFDGSFSLDGKVNLAMSGSLQVAPLAGAQVSGQFKRTTSGDYTAKLSFSANVLNAATVAFKGQIVKSDGVTIYDFSGKGSLNLGNIVKGGGSFRLTNIPGIAGLRADVNFAAGVKGTAYVAGSGSLAFSGDWWNGEFDGQLSTLLGSAQASVKLGNLRRKTGSCPNNGGQIQIGSDSYCQLPSTKLSFAATVTVFGQNFALSADISGEGFSVEAKAPSNYDGSNSTSRLNTLFPTKTVFWLPFTDVRVGAYWGGALSIQSGNPNRPAVAFSGVGRLIIDWYGDKGGTVAISGTFRPTKLCGKVWRVGFCV